MFLLSLHLLNHASQARTGVIRATHTHTHSVCSLHGNESNERDPHFRTDSVLFQINMQANFQRVIRPESKEERAHVLLAGAILSGDSTSCSAESGNKESFGSSTTDSC